jgi:hypothetical protein
MNQYLLLLHETPAAYAAMSPAEMGAIIERYAAWARGLGEQGLLGPSHKLADSGGVHLRRRSGALLATDGPYAEAKDLVGGFFTVSAASVDEAKRIAGTCPHLDIGSNWIEIREVDARA